MSHFRRSAPPLPSAESLPFPGNLIRRCSDCDLRQGCSAPVPGDGCAPAYVLFLGQNPGREEDSWGKPFVGQSGQQLDSLLMQCGLNRESVYTTNVVKCVDARTRVYLLSGKAMCIDHLVKTKYSGSVLSFDGREMVYKKVVGWYRSPLAKRRLLRITYQWSGKSNCGNTGYSKQDGVVVTEDHPVLTASGWKPAGELSVSDKIATGTVAPSSIAHQLVEGSLLGDAYISDLSCAYQETHCTKQRDYLMWKKRLYEASSLRVGASFGSAMAQGKRFPNYRIEIRSSHRTDIKYPYLRMQRERWYKNGKKIVPRDLVLTDLVLAVWFMDDGFRYRNGRTRSEIAAHGFSEDERLFLVALLKEKGLSCYSRRGRIHFDAPSTRKLAKIIAPFVPSCMTTKILATGYGDSVISDPGEIFFAPVSVQEVKPRYGQKSVYCIDVEDTHCFLTPGGIVHNCLTRNNAPPKPASVRACSKWLGIELGLVQPQIIVAMGAFAIRAVLGDQADTVEHLHGRPIEKDGHIILPCYHPAAGLHDTATLRFLYDDFQVLRGLLNGKTVADYAVRDEYPNPDYRVLGDDGRLDSLINEVREAGQVALDVETVDQDSKLWSVQASTQPGTGWFIPAGKMGLKSFDCVSWGADVVIHNYLHDIRFLEIDDNGFVDTMVMAYLCGLPQSLKTLANRLCGVEMRSYGEMVRPGQRRLSLDYLRRVSEKEWPNPPEIEETKWDNKAGKLVTKLKKPWHISRKIDKILTDIEAVAETDPLERWRNIPVEERACVEAKLGIMPESSLADIKFEDAVQYATRDADVTLRVKLKMEQLIHDADLDLVLYMDTRMLPMVHEMMRNGMAVDLDHFRNLSADYDARMRAKATELASIVGHPFNPSSSPQVAQVIYTELGFKPTQTTPTGLVSTDDQELKKTGHPVAKGIIEYRRLSKMKGTYSDNLVRSSIPDESGVPRIYTVLTTTRVETGRLSSKKGDNGEGAALQNIPTRSKEGMAIKMGFIAPEGKVLIEGDLAQIEMCTQAHLANCKGLIELFLSGRDPHTTTASKIFGVPYEEAKKDKYRYPCKRAGFGIIYLIGAKGLHDQIEEYISDLEMEGEPVEVAPWTEQECQKFIDEYYALYPEIKEYQMEQAGMARRYGFTVDLFGRRRFIPEVFCPIKSVNEAGLRQAANFPVTASAQGIIKTAMVELWRELPRMGWRSDVKWLMQIHDSLITEVKDDSEFLRRYIGWTRKIMTGVVKLAVPVKVDFKLGKQWGEMAKYEDGVL